MSVLLSEGKSAFVLRFECSDLREEGEDRNRSLVWAFSSLGAPFPGSDVGWTWHSTWGLWLQPRAASKAPPCAQAWGMDLGSRHELKIQGGI